MNKSYLSRYIHSLVSGSYADEKSEVSSLAERQYKVKAECFRAECCYAMQCET